MLDTIRPQPKTVKWRSPAYRKWIREQRCVICGCMPCQAAHQNVLGDKGTSTKVSDVCCLPLCCLCHYNEHTKGEESFWAGKNRSALIVKHIVRWLIHKKMNLRPLIQFINDWLARGRDENKN